MYVCMYVVSKLHSTFFFFVLILLFNNITLTFHLSTELICSNNMNNNWPRMKPNHEEEMMDIVVDNESKEEGNYIKRCFIFNYLNYRNGYRKSTK